MAEGEETPTCRLRKIASESGQLASRLNEVKESGHGSILAGDISSFWESGIFKR